MYLHIGRDIVLRQKEIIGIFDIETTSISKTTRQYLQCADKAGKVKAINTELPKSFIVCGETGRGREYTVYTSQISSNTLLKRFGLTGKPGRNNSGLSRV